jgi:hypothetical protein
VCVEEKSSFEVEGEQRGQSAQCFYSDG